MIFTIQLYMNLNTPSNTSSEALVKAELDYDDGMLIYEIDIRTAEGYKYEVKVDANTGAISRVKLD